MSLLDVMKSASSAASSAAVPAAFIYGEVVTVSPLVIRVDNRFEITGEAVVVPRELTAGPLGTHTHAIDPWETEEVPEHDHIAPLGMTSQDNEHSHAIPTHITGAETRLGLSAGDKVVLLRNQGGQQYLVLGRI